MWKSPGTPVPIDPSQLLVGLYVWLDVPWTEHPFLTNRLMVSSAKDIAVLQACRLEGRLYYYPEKSSTKPGPSVAPKTADPVGADAAAAAALAAEMLALEKEKKERLLRQRDDFVRAERAWRNAALQTREALLNLSRSPKVAGQQLSQLSRETAGAIASSQEVLLHLMGDKRGQGSQFHALNVMTLAMLLGKAVGLVQQELVDLAMAALAHDVGKLQIPAKVLESAHRKKFEEDFYRQHVRFSVQFAQESAAFSAEALAMIADHHEAVDGSGWPQGKTSISMGTRVLSLVDRYDRLCSPEALGVEALMPAEALAHMFRYEQRKFDPALLSRFIKLLGVYPPGTVVQLSDSSLALVVTPGANSLKPKVLIYSPGMPKDEAPIIDLSTASGLTIQEAIRPATLAPEVLDWLTPQQRLAYFYSITEATG